MNVKEELRKKAAAARVYLADAQLDSFELYGKMLATANRDFNLTSVPEPRYVDDHFVDSLTLLQAGMVKPDCVLVDIGSGSGLPGLAVRIAEPSIKTILIESNQKKAIFLEAVIEELHLSGARVYGGRAEEAGREISLREQCDVVVARGVAGLPVLLEYALPLAKRGGWVLAMKGPKAVEEIRAAGPALKALGGRLHRVMDPVGVSPELGKVIVIIEKIEPSPPRYPRRIGIPAKRPIRG